MKCLGICPLALLFSVLAVFCMTISSANAQSGSRNSAPPAPRAPSQNFAPAQSFRSPAYAAPSQTYSAPSQVYSAPSQAYSTPAQSNYQQSYAPASSYPSMQACGGSNYRTNSIVPTYSSYTYAPSSQSRGRYFGGYRGGYSPSYRSFATGSCSGY